MGFGFGGGNGGFGDFGGSVGGSVGTASGTSGMSGASSAGASYGGSGFGTDSYGSGSSAGGSTGTPGGYDGVGNSQGAGPGGGGFSDYGSGPTGGVSPGGDSWGGESGNTTAGGGWGSDWNGGSGGGSGAQAAAAASAPAASAPSPAMERTSAFSNPDATGIMGKLGFARADAPATGAVNSSLPAASTPTGFGLSGIQTPTGFAVPGTTAPAPSSVRSELDTLAFDSRPVSGTGYGLTGAQLTSASTSPHAATYDAPPLDGRTGAGSRSVQTAPERGIEIGDRELDALGRVQNRENPGYVEESWAAVNRAASGRWGDDVVDVLEARSQFEPVAAAGGRVSNLSRAPEAEQQIRASLSGPNPVAGMTHFANPAVVAARSRAGTVTNNTRDWVAGMVADPNNPRVGDHVFGNPDRMNIEAFTPNVTAGLNQFSQNGVAGTQFSMNPSAPPASYAALDAPTPPSRPDDLGGSRTAQVNIDAYLDGSVFSRAPMGTGTGLQAPRSQSNVEQAAMDLAFAPGVSAPSKNVQTASVGFSNPFGVSQAQAAPGSPASTQEYTGTRSASSQGANRDGVYGSGPSPVAAAAPEFDPDDAITVPAGSSVRSVAPGEQLALDQRNSSQVRQADQTNQGVVTPNAQGGVDVNLDTVEAAPEGRSLGQKAAGYAGQSVGSMMGGVIGTGIAGPIGGLVGGLLGGWAGDKIGDGQPYNEAWDAADGEDNPRAARDETKTAPTDVVKRLEEKYLLPMWGEPSIGNGRPTPRQRFVENRSNYARSL